MSTRTLVTHLFPHLDDVAGFWLLMRFDPAFAHARLKFIPTTAKGAKLRSGETGVGVGRGKYDEHKGDLLDSAASLIWKDLKRRKKLPAGLKGRAIAAMVEYVRRGDLGEYIGMPGNFYNLSGIFQTLAGLPNESSVSAMRFGLRALDALAGLYEERIKVEDAVARGAKFMTRWGKGVSLSVDALPGSVSSVVTELGYAIVVLRHPSGAYLHVRAAPTSGADVSRLANLVREEEPDKEWYFHHSKKLLLQGDLVAPTAQRTRFTPALIVALLEKFYGKR